jgi:hypothetical protein
MSPQELARANLHALLAEVTEAQERLRQAADEIAALDPGGAATAPARATVALLAVDLHSYYTLLESLLERVVVALEGQTPGGPSSHAALLKHASRSLETVRPALVRAASLDALDELRRFRHLFRHAYAFDLSFAKMRPALAALGAVHRDIDEDLTQLTAFLRRLIEEIETA